VSTPRARFCKCAAEPKAVAGLSVYLASDGVFTLNAAEADKDYPRAVGQLATHAVQGSKVLALQLDEAAVKAMTA
jgi:hypothetical protein